MDKSSTDLMAAAAHFGSLVESCEADVWSRPSPCDGWTARDVVTHVIGNLRGVTAGASGGDFFSGHAEPITGDLVEAYRDARSACEQVLEALPDTFLVGGNPVPAPMMVDGVMRDIVIHSWDLARAVDADDTLPETLVAAATAAMAMVTDQLRGPGLYGQIVNIGDDASPQDRLIALSGRRP